MQVDPGQAKPVIDFLLDRVMVTLQLIPVGCKLYNMTMPQLRQLIKCMLTALMVIHAAGFVHRDVREDNMVATQSGFCLIDWELAGRNNEIVFWEGQSLPEDVNLKIRPFVYTDDLWQLGQTIKHLAMPTPEIGCICRWPLVWSYRICTSCSRSFARAIAFGDLQDGCHGVSMLWSQHCTMIEASLQCKSATNQHRGCGLSMQGCPCLLS